MSYTELQMIANINIPLGTYYIGCLFILLYTMTLEKDNQLVNVLTTGQKKYIPYRQIKSIRNDPRWMTDRLKYMIGMKRGIYKRIKSGKTNLRDRYSALARWIKKRNYEIKVAKNAKKKT